MAHTLLEDRCGNCINSADGATGGPKDGQLVDPGARKIGAAVKLQFRKPGKGESALTVTIVETVARN